MLNNNSLRWTTIKQQLIINCSIDNYVNKDDLNRKKNRHALTVFLFQIEYAFVSEYLHKRQINALVGSYSSSSNHRMIYHSSACTDRDWYSTSPPIFPLTAGVHLNATTSNKSRCLRMQDDIRNWKTAKKQYWPTQESRMTLRLSFLLDRCSSERNFYLKINWSRNAWWGKGVNKRISIFRV